MTFDASQRAALLDLARRSISAGLSEARHVPYAAEHLPPALDIRRASFVTLRIDGVLRGCCGSIEVRYPLAQDVWRNAWASAFADPRFPALTADEFAQCDIHISVLSELEPLIVADERELLRTVRAGIDGLVLSADGERVTFLPSVWEQLPEPEQFLRHLKLKAGWPAEAWPANLRVWRYTTEEFGKSH